MPKKAHQQPAKAAPASVPAKRPGVRSLQTIEDLRRLQGRLIKQFMAGELGREDFKAAMYGTTCLCATLRELKPPQGQLGNVVTLVEIVGTSPEEEQAIAAMNANIMPPPEGNQ